MSSGVGSEQQFTSRHSYRGRVAAAGAAAGWWSALLVVVLTALALNAAAASAATGHRYSSQFSGPGSASGDLSSPAGLAIEASSGDVYVVDVGNNRVQRFDSSGVFVSKFDLSAADGAGSLGGAIAIDQASGDVYVSATRGDSSASVVNRFSGAGAYLSQIDGSTTPAGSFGGIGGLAVDPTDGTLYVSDQANNAVDVFDDAGVYLSRFGVNGGNLDDPAEQGETYFPGLIAVGSGGQVYVVDGFGSRVQEFAAQGASFTAVVNSGSVYALAVDPSNGHLYEGGFGPSGYEVSDLTPAGDREFSFGAGRVGFSTGLAATASGRVYATDSSSNAIVVFRPFLAPSVSTDPASAVMSDSATLNATVNPEGVATTYRFEYGLDTSYGQSTGESDPPETGSGDVAASAPITGLAANTTYHYRVVATNADGSNAGADQTFTTATAAPEVDTTEATGVKFDRATLRGTVDPNNSQATYHFEYGTDTGYGSSTPDGDAGSGTDPMAVSAAITGLQPATTYHYKLVADNGTGGPVSGPDRTFTTGDLPPTATTSAVTDITASSATVHGTVDTKGLSGTYQVAIRQLDGNYSQATAPVDVPAGPGPVTVAVALSGLPAGGSYSVRLSVTTTAGSDLGEAHVFATQAGPPYVPPPRPTPTPDTSTPPAVTDPPPAAPTRKFKVTRPQVLGMVATLKVTVPNKGRITASGKRLRKVSLAIGSGRTKAVRLTLTKAGRTLLKKSDSGRLRIKATIRYRPTGGATRTTTRTLTFHRKASR